MKKQFLIFLLCLFFSTHASAILMMRAGYGFQGTPSEKYRDHSLKDINGFHVDALLQPGPMGFGLRYERVGFDLNSNELGNKKSDLSRLSFLLNYRFIDSFAFLGAIGSFGFSNDLNVPDPDELGDLKSKSDFTYTVGIEGGISPGLITIGGELGYAFEQIYRDEQGWRVIDERGSRIRNRDEKPKNESLNLNGLYFKFLVGIDFNLL